MSIKKCFPIGLALLLLLFGCGGDMDENMPCSFCVASCGGKEYDPEKAFCSNGTVKKYEEPLDYEGRTYKTVKIGTYIWMAENLNVGDSIKCNNYDCNKYGRLYDWATAMQLPHKCDSTLSTSGDADCKINPPHQGICPKGWHISRFYEWSDLITSVESNFAGKNLKATKGWNSNNGKSGNGYNVYGFTALPGGYGYLNITPDIFDLPLPPGYVLPYTNVVGDIGYWWIAEDNTGFADSAFYSSMTFNSDEVAVSKRKKSYSHNVRCVKDP